LALISNNLGSCGSKAQIGNGKTGVLDLITDLVEQRLVGAEYNAEICPAGAGGFVVSAMLQNNLCDPAMDV
jgi:hypothetical protein